MGVTRVIARIFASYARISEGKRGYVGISLARLGGMVRGLLIGEFVDGIVGVDNGADLGEGVVEDFVGGSGDKFTLAVAEIDALELVSHDHAGNGFALLGREVTCGKEYIEGPGGGIGGDGADEGKAGGSGERGGGEDEGVMAVGEFVTGGGGEIEVHEVATVGEVGVSCHAGSRSRGSDRWGAGARRPEGSG